MANDDGGDDFGPILPAGSVAAAVAEAQERAYKASGHVLRQQLARRARDASPQMQQGDGANDAQQQGETSKPVFGDWASI